MTDPTAGHRRRYTRRIWAAVVLAALWSAALIVGATRIPVYGSTTSSTNAHGRTRVSHHATTLVEVNGSGVLVVVAIPLAATLLVAIALLRPRTGRVAQAVALVAAGLVGFLGLLSLLTIGLVIVPVAALLGTACALDMNRQQSDRTSSREF